MAPTNNQTTLKQDRTSLLGTYYSKLLTRTTWDCTKTEENRGYGARVLSPNKEMTI